MGRDELPAIGEGALRPIELRPIGWIRTPFGEKREAPRQAVASHGARGRIELVAGMGLEDAVDDLSAWTHIWVIFVFHLNEGWKPKVQPPRSEVKRGVFATRAPHRPNPIGMSAVRLESVDGLVLHVADVDMVDGSPVLDLKPYVPYADAIADAGSGWLDADEPRPPARGPSAPAGGRAQPSRGEEEADPLRSWDVTFVAGARAELDWLARAHGVDLEGPLVAALALGPAPHAYRRIRKIDECSSVIALKAWRATFRASPGERRIVVERVRTGYRDRELEAGGSDEIELHRAFARRFA
jgi:tRNA-Thr(GGU) m(6)t(6)A37 methyltransferase TsaA